jgi:magnesium chelatase family protein
MLVAAMNPCPCGYRTDPTRECTCHPASVERYLARLSGPLLDRIDLHVEVPRIPHEELMSRKPSESSESIRARVQEARERQRKRFAKSQTLANGQMTSKQVRQFCTPDSEGDALLRTAISKLGLSARSYDRILKVARTIADLDGSDSTRAPHVAEALQYRKLEMKP